MLTIGRELSHYRILEKLGQGGMGVVYRALDTHLDRQVAIKVLRSEAVTDPERKKRFIREAKAASALNNPHVITVYDISTADGLDFIAMEYVRGMTLDHAIGRRGLKTNEALTYAVQVADALAAAHAAGIIHRDLKPANIMIADTGMVKVLDFGLAKLMEPVQDVAVTETIKPESPKTEDGAILGTVAYMSPEQAEGKTVDRWSDIFSFGVILYEMITGRRAFSGETKMSTISAILRDEPEPLSRIVEGVPRELERVVGRCLRKDPRRRFQNAADLKLALEELKEEFESGTLGLAPQMLARSSGRRRSFHLALVAGAALLAGVVGTVLWRARPPLSSRPLILSRLTSDAGLTTDPALSPDGRFVAYASDRGAQENLDIWLQSVNGSDTARLTHDTADEREPSFSPDGTRIVFRSERDRGGIYVVSTLGGEPRLIAEGGRGPRFSPDGRRIAYWTGGLGGDLSTPGTGQIWLIDAGGGTARQLATGFAAARYPVWSPEGEKLLFFGTRESKGPPEYDWWVVSVDGGNVERTGAFGSLQREGLTGYTFASAWRSDGVVVFSARLGDSTNLWQISVSPKTGQVNDRPQRLTSGAGLEIQPSAAAGGLLVFSSLVENIDVWALPLDANRIRIRGAIQRLTQNAAIDAWPCLSADGKRMVFASQRSGNWDIWIKDLESGKENALTSTPSDEFNPVITADGSKVAYSTGENRKPVIHVVSSRGGTSRKLCDDCSTPWDWSSDGKQLLYQPVGTERQRLLTVDSGDRTDVLEHSQFKLYQAHFSPDGRWLSFLAWISPVHSRVFVAPFRPDDRASGPGQWMAITEVEGIADKPRWAPDGMALYYVSDRDGFRCIWVQRLNPANKAPVGSPIPVYHSHSARLSLMNVMLYSLEISVARDRIAFNQGERTGNVWLARQISE